MARCPHCSYKLAAIDVKAECPVCGVNIPNYNWEERLELDAVNSEKSFAVFRRKVSAFKNAVFGSKFRAARFVLTFAPIIFALFPMVTIDTSLPFSNGSEPVSMLSVILAIVNGQVDIGSMLGFMSLEKSGTAFTVLYAALLLVILGVAAGVLNFFVLLLSGVGFHAKANIVCCAASILFFIGAVGCVIVSSSMLASIMPGVMSVKLSFSLFIGLALFIVNLVMNVLARKQFAADKAEYRQQALEEYQKFTEEAAA